MAKSAPTTSYGPCFLRLALGVIFLFAGLTKVVCTATVTGEDAVLLADMGITADNASLPDTLAHPETVLPKQPAPSLNPPPVTNPANPAKTRAARPAAVEGKSDRPRRQTLRNERAPDAPVVTLAAFAPRSGAVQVSQAYMLALMLKKSAAPVADADHGPALWPAALASGRRPVYAAYACVLAELIGGAFVLVGALTRVGAVMIAGVMLTAMWLTQIGPAIRGGNALLGFLPRLAMDDPAWQGLMFQFTLLCAALALMALGCGRWGLDRSLFPRGGGGAAKPRPAAPAEE